VGNKLLADSASYDIAVAMSAPEELAVRGLVVRIRRFVRAAFLLADADMRLEAMALVRSAAEYAITLGWILRNPDPHVRRFAISGIDDRLDYDDLAFEIAGRRVFTDDERAGFEASRESMGQRGMRMPKLKQRAKESDLIKLYAGYVQDSQAVTHPTMWAIDMTMEHRADPPSHIMYPDVAPDRRMADPYYRGAYALGLSLWLVARHENNDELADRIYAMVEPIEPHDTIVDDQQSA
jgi:hypothetical protein